MRPHKECSLKCRSDLGLCFCTSTVNNVATVFPPTCISQFFFSFFFCKTYIFILFDRHPVHQGLGSHLQINADDLCDELTANLIKLEKVTSFMI